MNKNVRTVADFRAAHDPNVIVPAKIKNALAAMLKEHAEMWEYEGDFIRRAQVSQTQIGQFREQFASHVVETPSTSKHSTRRVWFADPKVAKSVREA